MDTEFKIDSVLVEETIAGNAKAYDQLYVRYTDEVLAMLKIKCGGDEALAKDIMQEAFIKAFVNIRKFDPQYTFKQWIYAIARNLFIDHTRRRRSEQRDLITDTPCDMPNPEQRVISKQNNTALEAAINNLPKHYRTVFAMRYLEELSYEEISEKLSMPMGTVKTHIHRSRERFLRELGVVSFE